MFGDSVADWELENLQNKFFGQICELRDQIDWYEKYQNNPCRNSKWITKTGITIIVKNMDISHMQNILNYKSFKTPLPEEWVKLLKAELYFRKININSLRKQYQKLRELEDKIF